MDTLLLLIIAGLLWRNLDQPPTCQHTTGRSWLQEPFAAQASFLSPEQRISHLTDQAVRDMFEAAAQPPPTRLP